MTEFINVQFIRALSKEPERRTLQDLRNIYYGLAGLEGFAQYSESALVELCKIVRYEHHQANDVLFYTGELSTCWYVLLSGSVFIDGSMFLPRSRWRIDMQKHAIQLADYIDKQKDEREKYVIEYRNRLAKKQKEDSNKHDSEREKSGNERFKTKSCESVARETLFGLEGDDCDPENVSGCFGRSSNVRAVRPPASPPKRRQALLDPIRRWNSFHMRDRKMSPHVVKTLEQFRKEYAKSVEKSAEKGKDGTSSTASSTAVPSIAAAGLMGALPRVLALRNEYLRSETSFSDALHQDQEGKLQCKKQLSVESYGQESIGKGRALSQGDVGNNIPLHLREVGKEGMTLTRQITRELLLAAKRNSSKELLTESTSKESKVGPGKTLRVEIPSDSGRHRTRSEGEDTEERLKTPRESSEKLPRRKTNDGSIGEKYRRWSDRDDTETEVETRSATNTRSSASDLEDDLSDCFGKRSRGSARRPNECFVLEPSDMIAIDYPEGQTLQQNRRHNMDRGVNLVFDENFSQNRPELYQKSNRSSHSSDTSSAYSGSDTMTSVQSSLEADEVDLSGLMESVVDSDEEDLAESIDSLTVRDHVRECLEKDPSERTDQDIEILLELTQHLKAFTNMTLAVRRALCAVMVFAVVEKANTIVMNDGEELDSWSVLINGHVEVEHSNGEVEQLNLGDCFGILPTMEKLYHRGVMRTKCDDCQFVCITQTDYYRIQHQGEENTRRHEENGRLVMVTEQRGGIEVPSRRGHIVIRGTPERLMLQLIEENSIDPTYVEDFLLTHRTFIDSSIDVAQQLLEWFGESSVRDRVTRVVLLWVNNHFTDFETDPAMMEFLETFEAGLEREKMQGQLRLLNIACAAKARTRNVTLARPSRDQALNFSILGGYEKGFGIFISKVEKKSKAEQVGLKRGDQILEVNGQSFEHVTHVRALEILKGTTHLSITVKSNLLAFKEMLSTPDNSPRPRGRKVSEIAKLQTDPRARHSTSGDPRDGQNNVGGDSALVSASPLKDKAHKSFMTLGPKKRLQKALMKMNILPKNTINEGNSDESVVDSSCTETTLYHSQSNQDLYNLYDDRAVDYPEHVLKVYKPDQTCKYLLVHKETTAHEVVMLALQEFGITDPSSRFSLCEVSVAEGGIIKQRRLPDQLQNLAERIGLSSRYYLKTNGVSETLVADEMAPELIRESHVHFLQLNAIEVAIQLTLQDFSIFRQIESTEYVDDLFQLKSRYGVPMLTQFAELVNREMFWVVTEVCSEHNLMRRSKIIKQFIKVARQCKECKNFNSMFAIVSGLGHGAVSRLRLSWEKLPTKYQRLFSDLQDLMDPSRNMSKYRQLISSEVSQPPIIPFYPVVKKDLTFIHLGNDSRVEGLINFEKLRMIAKEVRQLTNMCSSPYDLLTMLELGGQPPSSAMFALNQMTTGSGPPQANSATVKRRKKSTAAPNPKKMFEEAQMVRRVKAYLNNMKVTTDEEKLHQLSLECEPAGTVPSAAPIRKRHPSPTLSTTSSASSTSEGKKGVPKFGTASPQAVRKMLALSESNKTRPHCPRHPVPQLPLSGLALHHPTLSPSPSPSSHRRMGSVVVGMSNVGHGGRAMHERSHSDTPTLPLPVHLSAESSSVTSLSNLPLRKTVTSGSVTSSDSGHSTQLDSHSGSSIEVQHGGYSPLQMRRHSALQPGVGMMPPPPPRARHPPAYSVATQMARLHKLGRAHSHEGVVGYYHTDPEEDDDEDAQVSAV